MNNKTLIASLALVAGIAGISPLVQAAQTSTSTVEHSPSTAANCKLTTAPRTFISAAKKL